MKPQEHNKEFIIDLYDNQIDERYFSVLYEPEIW